MVMLRQASPPNSSTNEIERSIPQQAHYLALSPGGGC